MSPIDLTRLVGLAAIWGGSFLFMRIAVPELGVVPAAFGRVVLGTLGLLAILAVMGVPRRFNGRFGATLMLGCFNSGIPVLMFSIAARLVPAGYSAVLNATTPLMGVLVGALFFGERATPSKLLGVLCGLLGVGVLTGAGPVPFDISVLAGAVACLIATACYGLSSFLTRRWIGERGGLDSRLVALGSQVGALLFLAPFMAWNAATTTPALPTASLDAWLALAALGLLCTSVAYGVFFSLIARVGPVKALTVTFVIPVFGVLWGHLFLGEVLSLAHAAGAGLITVALWLVLRMPAAVPARLEPGT